MTTPTPIDPPAKPYEEDSDEEDDDDTVVGTCLHCNCPPPPRSERGCSTSFSSTPCPASDPCGAEKSGSAGGGNNNDATRVQVSCDDCRSFICDGCHWCHEFQANHEIRVCDRCDAFYCRACDEMDQCEDCSEVVCNTCSTLMSCKFCGCGLCEDCATACGRCGIVLCARDAKFAVECDTCKMSYCLVCLASGTKDPCVRCGHRPSKRVEQLVHLRLKSIYKAFKQSGASKGGPGPPSGGEGGCSASSSGDDAKHSGGRDTSSTYRGKYSSALRSLTENESVGLRSMEGSTNFDQSMANEVAAVLQTASKSMADGGDDRRSRGRRVTSHPPPPFSTHDHAAHVKAKSQHTHVPPRSSPSPLWRRTQEEIEAATAAAEASAEAAAAALLAELEEEEVNGPSNKGKKKKKKKDKKKESSEPVLDKSAPSGDDANSSVKNKSSDLDKSSGSLTKKKGSKPEPVKPAPIEDESSDEEEMILEQLVGMHKSSDPPKKEREKKEKEKPVPIVEPPPPPPPPPADEVSPDLEKELSILISNNDEAALEEFLASLKGVPGLSVLRKAAKKALKKLKDEKAPPEAKHQNQSSGNSKSQASGNDSKPSKKAAAQNKAAAAVSQPTSQTIQPATAGNQHEPLLRVVSRTQSAVGGASKGGAASSSSVPASARAECVMHMSPTVVGWVIGKGGQRIRDMMEESGAKIWIDQESMGAKDARVVYVSGKRSAVDAAVRMVKDLIAKAPVAASSGAPAQPTAQPPAGVPQAPPVSVKATSPVIAPLPTPSIPDAAPSFAEAAAHAVTTTTTVPVVKTPATTVAATANTNAPSAKPPVAKKASTPGWPDANVSVPPQQPPKSEAPAPKSAPSPAPSVDDQSKNIAALMNAARQPSENVTLEIACDPQFVSLLLGRDGLAARSIQTESGASLHFNPHAEPGKIRILGKAENVAKAEQLIHGVLKYRNEQLKQEAQKANIGNMSGSAPLGAARPDLSLKQGGNLYASEQRMRPDISSLSSMQLHNLPRPGQEDLLFQNQRPPQIQSALAVDHMNFPPGYDPHQRQHSLGSTNPMLHRQSPLSHLQRPTTSPSMVDPNIRHQQQEWGQLPQTHIPNQYMSSSQYSIGQMSGNQIGGNNNYLGSNIYAPSSNPTPQSTMTPTAFASLSDQNLNFLHNLDAPRQAPAPHDFLNAGNNMESVNGRHDMNGWGLNANGGATIGDSWNHNQAAPPAARVGLHPDFATQRSLPLDTTPSLSGNLFLNRQIPQSQAAPQSSAKPKIDDSRFVDSMFDSLGESGKDGDGLLDALNAVSLGGLQGGTWGSTLGGWGGGSNNNDSSSLLHDSRRGSIGFGSNLGNLSHPRDGR